MIKTKILQRSSETWETGVPGASAGAGQRQEEDGGDLALHQDARHWRDNLPGGQLNASVSDDEEAPCQKFLFQYKAINISL